MKCEKCNKTITTMFRCDEHYRCDDCGTKSDLCTYREGVLCGPCEQKRVQKRIAEFKGETNLTDEVTCPYCGYVHSDSWEMADSDDLYMCPDCGNKFSYERNISVTYSSQKI